MKLDKALFCFTLLCISATLAEFRHFPDRSKMFCEENHSSHLPPIRNLEDATDNSHNKSSSHQKVEPITVRLQGSTELGYYYVTLFMGSPVQKQTLIVDTGSVTTTIPCVECGHDCGTHHFDKPFDNSVSKSFEQFKCKESFGEYTCSDCSQHCPFAVSYVEGSSYKGHFNKDFVVFGNEIEDNYALLKQNTADQSAEQLNARKSVEDIIEERKVFMPFGCTNKETKLFYDQEADGILGLGVNTNTLSSPPNILDALNIHNHEFSKAFSLCLAQDGGYFSMGGYNAAYHLPNEKIQYISYSDAFSQYKVFLSRIDIEGENIGLKHTTLNTGEGAFFDSGTTLTHVPTATYNALRSNMKDYCSGDSERCGKNSETTSFCWKYHLSHYSNLAEFFETFPTFTFVFGKDDKVNYEWKAEDYLYEKEDVDNEYCLGLSRYDRETILGGTFMKNHDILFDKEKKRIGFVRADCGAVQQLVKPTYLEKKEANGEVDRPKNTKNVASKNTDFWNALTTFNAVIKVAIAILAVTMIIVVLICIFRKYMKRRTYYPMRNINVEVQSAGINDHPLNSSPTQTPELKGNQPAQEEKPEADSYEQNSTEIRVE